MLKSMKQLLKDAIAHLFKTTPPNNLEPLLDSTTEMSDRSDERSDVERLTKVYNEITDNFKAYNLSCLKFAAMLDALEETETAETYRQIAEQSFEGFKQGEEMLHTISMVSHVKNFSVARNKIDTHVQNLQKTSQHLSQSISNVQRHITMLSAGAYATHTLKPMMNAGQSEA